MLSDLEESGAGVHNFVQLPDVLTQKTMSVSTVNVAQQEDVDQWKC